MLAMTSPTAQLQLQPQLPKPVLLTKPVGKYRAPVAPPAHHLDNGCQQADPTPQPSTTATNTDPVANHTCSFSAAGADGPLTITNVSTAPAAAATVAATASVPHHPDLSPASSTKYRAPGPPTSSPTTATSVSTTPSCNISSNSNYMRREPMQVLRTNSYNNSSGGGGGGGGIGGQINPNNNNNNDVDVDETDSDTFRDKLQAIKKSDLSSPVLDSCKNGSVDGSHEHALQIKAGVDKFSLVDASRILQTESVSGSNSKESRPATVLPPGSDGTTSQSTAADAVTEKPIVADVKLINRLSINSGRQPVSLSVQIRPCRSTESIAAIDQLNALLASGLALMTSSTANGDASEPSSSKAEQAKDESAVAEKPVRSSFVDPNSLASQSGRRSVYIDLGEYQTLLKHGQEDAVYSLPQPQCYGDETLKAVRLITEKYDTFKRRQLRAISFRDGAVVKPQFGSSQPSSNGSGPDDVVGGQVSAIAEGVELADDGSRNEPGESAAVTTQPSDQHVPDRTSLKPQCEAASGQNDDVSAPQTTSNLSRPVVSLSRYRLESVGHVGMSSTDDVTLLPPEVEMDAQVDDDCFGGVSRTDRLRIEMFYRSRETSVYVCRSLADMFLGACSSTETAAVAAAQCWVHVHTGVPVWLLNSGRGAVRRRELILVLADRLSGFPLWRDRINYLSNYTSTSLPTPTTTTTTAAPTPAPPPDVVGHVSETQSGGISVHSLRLSGSLTKVVRLAIFDGHSADAFFAKFQEITADPNDDLWRISDVGSSLVTGRASGRRKDAKRPSSMLLCAGRRSRRRHDHQLSKTAISQPCSVVHVARIDPHQPSFRAAFSDFIVGLLPAAVLSDQSNQTQSANTTTVCAPNGESGNRDDTSNRNSWPTDDFRPRLPTN